MIYVMSDIHGNLRRFQSILNQIRLQETDTLYILGDVIDRHRHGIPILRKIMAMPNAKMLLGNHEHMMLLALGQPYDENDDKFPMNQAGWLANWYRNGGDVTHRHLKRIRKQLRSEIFVYLRDLPLCYDVTVGGTLYRLVHSAPEALYSQYADKFCNPTHFTLWKRMQPAEAMPEDAIYIFGHTPTQHFQAQKPMELFFGQNRIGIDCGSGFSDDPQDANYGYGRLACLRLDDGKVFYSE